MGVGVKADGGQFQFAGEGPAVERFDIDQLVDEAIRPGVDLARGQGVEHEGIVGVGAVADADQLSRIARHGTLADGDSWGGHDPPSIARVMVETSSSAHEAVVPANRAV